MQNSYKNVDIHLIFPIYGLDDRVRFVADPFFLDRHTVLVEVFADRPREKWIGAIDIKDVNYPHYVCDVLRVPREEFSFPFVFSFKNEFYLLPQRTEVCLKNGKHLDTSKENYLCLYKILYLPKDGPLDYMSCPYAEIIHPLGIQGVDPVIFSDGQLYYLIVSRSNRLYLYFNRNPTSKEWELHPESPLPIQSKRARMGGRPLYVGGKLYLFLQESFPNYGYSTLVYEVTTLSSIKFVAKEVSWSPIICAQHNEKWNHDGMHHVDFDISNNKAVVDGHREDKGWSIALVHDVQWGRSIFPETTRSRLCKYSRVMRNNTTTFFKRLIKGMMARNG